MKQNKTKSQKEIMEKNKKNDTTEISLFDALENIVKEYYGDYQALERKYEALKSEYEVLKNSMKQK